MQEASATAPSLELGAATGVSIDLPLAGAGSRGYAYIIDFHIRLVLPVLYWIVLSVLAGLGVVQLDVASGFDENTPTDPGFLLGFFGVPSLLFLLYHPVVELAMRGDSPGKRIAGIHCVDSEGQPPGAGAILLRNVLRVIDSLPMVYTVGLVAVMITRQHQRLGDLVAGTRVVQAPKSARGLVKDLGALDKSNLSADELDLVTKILARWSTLRRDRRQELTESVLLRQGITPAAKDGQRRRQLKALLGQ
ncbi:MAG: RDD family protein [Pseudomonadota bacterium]